MWRFKMCPRCEGDIFVDKDISTWYEKCLQCGYERELKSMVEREKQPDKSKKKRVPALRT